MSWNPSPTRILNCHSGRIVLPQFSLRLVSTGEPKGVYRDHRQFLHSTWLNTNGYYVSPSERQSLLYSPGFTASVPNIYDTLLNGATLCSLNPRHVSPTDLLNWLHQEKITHFNPPIGLWRELVQAVTPGSSWPDLRLVTLVGQAIYGKDIRDFQSLFGKNTVLLYALGMTEAGAVTHGYFDKNTVVGDGPVPAGYPLPDKYIEIVDETDTPVPTGETGRLTITSSYLSLGYWQDTVKTESCFLSKNDGSGLRTFVTSDRGQIRFDGCLEFFGREDSVIKIRGFRVDTAAIEAALNSHPHINQAVVVPRKRSYGDVFLVAYLTGGTEEYRPSAEELHSYLGQSLPYFMTADRFAWLDKLPLTASGKINRQVLSLLSTPRPAVSTPFVKPETDHEQQIAQIWAELLEIDQAGLNDDWVELGGDSLLAMRMIQLVERKLGIQAPPEFYSALTIKQLIQMFTATSDENPVAEQEKIADDTHFIPQKPTGMIIQKPKKMLRRIIRKGPILGNKGLSYALGTRLQWLMVRQLWLLKRVYGRRLAPVLLWQEELENKINNQSLETNLIANTWLKWRDQALIRSGEFERWVRITGEGKHLLTTTDVSAGSVFLIPHTGWMMSTLEKFIRRCGRETAIITIDLSISNAGGTEMWHAQQVRSRTAQLWKAQQVLQRNGAVFIAGDGRQGNQSVEVAFHGRRRPFQTGAAWLAVMNDSHFVPVFAKYESDGHIEVEVNPALISKAESKEEQIIELTQKYGRLYAERWPQFYTSMDWTHLLYNLNLPKML